MGSRGRIIYDLVSIWTIFGACVSPLLADTTDPPEIIDFNVWSSEMNEEVHVHLVPTETFLANENVPVWITSQLSNSVDSPLILQNTMRELGPFTAYWDHDTCSAALYFHETKQLEGTIGHHHIIHKLKYNSVMKRVEPSADTVLISPVLNHNQFRLDADIVATTIRNKVSSLRAYPETVYIETLVMVNNDITADFGNNYASIATYLMALFNTVDMLFSKIEIPHIKINIAGIIIATEQFPQFTSDCYDTIRSDDNKQITVLRINKISKAIRRTLNDYEHHIPIQSYDVVVFLTRSPLIGSKSRSAIFGVSLLPKSEYKYGTADVGISIISDPENFQRFPTVAHEMAHLLGAPHDGGPLFTEDGSCNANLMRSPGSRCRKCMTFGGQTPQYFRTFFGTRDACIFHNKPRSLNNPRSPQLFWTPREQCECYGYNRNYHHRICSSMMSLVGPRINCASKLKCVNDNDKDRYFTTNVFMDGTPCAKSRKGTSVCWDGECVPLQKDSEQKQLG